MNKILAKYARQQIKYNLGLCTESQQFLFKKMYGDKIDRLIDEVVDLMPDGKLDWALTQVENTVEINRKNYIANPKLCLKCTKTIDFENQNIFFCFTCGIGILANGTN